MAGTLAEATFHSRVSDFATGAARCYYTPLKRRAMSICGFHFNIVYKWNVKCAINKDMSHKRGKGYGILQLPLKYMQKKILFMFGI